MAGSARVRDSSHLQRVGSQLQTLRRTSKGFFPKGFYLNSPFASSPSTEIDTVEGISAGPMMPCSIHLSNGFGGDPSQGIRAFLGSRSDSMHARWGHTSVEAVRVFGSLLKIQIRSLLKNGGEDLVREIINGSWHAVINRLGNRERNENFSVISSYLFSRGEKKSRRKTKKKRSGHE